MSVGDSVTESDVEENVPLPLVANVIVSVAAGVPVGTRKNWATVPTTTLVGPRIE
jgi:hypothetical protein